MRTTDDLIKILLNYKATRGRTNETCVLLLAEIATHTRCLMTDEEFKKFVVYCIYGYGEAPSKNTIDMIIRYVKKNPGWAVAVNKYGKTVKLQDLEQYLPKRKVA